MKIFLIHQAESTRDISRIVERFDPIIIEPLKNISAQQSLNETVQQILRENELPLVILEDDLIFEDFITPELLEGIQKWYKNYDTIKFTTMNGNFGTQMVIYNNVTEIMKSGIYDIDCRPSDVKTKIIPFTMQPRK